MPNYFVKSGHQISGFISVLDAAFGNFRARRKLFGHYVSRSVIERPSAAGKQKILCAVFLMNFVFIRQVIANHRSEEHTSELQSRGQLVCRLLLEKKNTSRASRSISPPSPTPTRPYA